MSAISSDQLSVWGISDDVDPDPSPPPPPPPRTASLSLRHRKGTRPTPHHHSTSTSTTTSVQPLPSKLMDEGRSTNHRTLKRTAHGSHSRLSPPSPSTASTVSPQIPPVPNALDPEGFPIPSHSLSSVRRTAQQPLPSKPAANGAPHDVLPKRTPAAPHKATAGEAPRTVALSKPPPKAAPSSAAVAAPHPVAKPVAAATSFEWLRGPNTSRVLSRNEIESVVNHSMLTGFDREVAEKRIQCLSLYKGLIARQWGGLCRYDHPDRIKGVVDKLHSEKKALTQEMIQLIKKSNNCKSDDDKRRQTLLVRETPVIQQMLLKYRDLVKSARRHHETQKGAAHGADRAANGRPFGAHSVAHSASFSSASAGGGCGGAVGAAKSALSTAMAPSNTAKSAPFYSFGRSADKFDYSLNPEFCAAFRGHMLSHDEFEHFAALRALEHDDDGGATALDDDGSAAECADDVASNVSLLGAASGSPPSIGAIQIFRDKTNEHQKTLQSNLRTLYGDDWRKYVGSDGRYTAHLLSQYEMDRLLGNGVYGHVFKAKTKNTNHVVAIKALQLVCTGKQKQIQDERQSKLREWERNDICPYIMNECIPVPVIREIMCLKMMDHPNITKLYDIVLNDPVQCHRLPNDHPLRSVTTVEYNKRDTRSTQWNLHLVQEYVPNELYKTYQNLLCLHLEENHTKPEFKGTNIKTLTPRIMPKQNGKWFSCASMKSVMQDILRGLEYLSAISYVHRDLKPANLLLTDDGVVKIADFGLSRPKYKANELLTNNHNVVTRYYRAPEILVEQDKKVSAYGFASDVWSAGAIFAELIYSRPVFEGSSDVTMIFEIIKKCGGISEETWPGISSVLTRDPPPDFVKTDPKTKKPRRWEKGERQFNFLRNLKPEFRSSARKMSELLKPWISHSWTAENVRQGLDLLDRMLCYSPKDRITPTEALRHSWFTMSPKPDRKELKAMIARSKTYKRKSRTPQPPNHHHHHAQHPLHRHSKHSAMAGGGHHHHHRAQRGHHGHHGHHGPPHGANPHHHRSGHHGAHGNGGRHGHRAPPHGHPHGNRPRHGGGGGGGRGGGHGPRPPAPHRSSYRGQHGGTAHHHRRGGDRGGYPRQRGRGGAGVGYHGQRGGGGGGGGGGHGQYSNHGNSGRSGYHHHGHGHGQKRGFNQSTALSHFSAANPVKKRRTK